MSMDFSQLGKAADWEAVLRALIKFAARPEENEDDILAGIRLVGYRRARLIGRPFDMVEDLGFGLTMFCINPFKPPLFGSNQSYLADNRWKLFIGASNDPYAKERFQDAVEDELLRKPLLELYQALLSEDISRYIHLG